jgi:hypothetical protein
MPSCCESGLPLVPFFCRCASCIVPYCYGYGSSIMPSMCVWILHCAITVYTCIMRHCPIVGCITCSTPPFTSSASFLSPSLTSLLCLVPSLSCFAPLCCFCIVLPLIYIPLYHSLSCQHSSHIIIGVQSPHAIPVGISHDQLGTCSAADYYDTMVLLRKAYFRCFLGFHSYSYVESVVNQ